MLYEPSAWIAKQVLYTDRVIYIYQKTLVRLHGISPIFSSEVWDTLSESEKT